MLAPHLLRPNLDFVINGLSKRGYKLDTEVITELESRRKQVQITTQEFQQERNARSKEIGKVKAQGGDVESLLKQVGDLGDRLKASEAELEQIQGKLNYLLMSTPNIPHASVPEGTSEADNREIRRWGDLPKFDFEPRDHVDLGEALGLIDFEAATRITASRFVVMSGAIARLHRALIQFMLDIHTQEHGYTEVNVPYMVNAESMRGTGQLPKFKEDLFGVSHGGIFDYLNIFTDNPDFEKTKEIIRHWKNLRGMRRRYYRNLLCRIVSWLCVVLILASLLPRPMISKSGCPGSRNTARSPHAVILRISRRAA